jgi:hypothetical protein
MKAIRIAFGLALVTAAGSAIAVVFKDYHDWPTLEHDSQAIIIARCKSTPEWMHYTNGVLIMNPALGLVESEMEVEAVLKGTNSPTGTPIRFGSEFWPRQGENYLIMAQSYDGVLCRANEKYRIIPLGLFFTTNALTGKTVEEKIRQMLQFRVDHLDQQLQEDKAEKQRLDNALKDLKR